MKRASLMDLYSDFLSSSPQIASALVMAKVLNDTYSHDSITRMLSQPEINQKTYWRSIKKIVRRVEDNEGVISIDDFILHKPHSSQNEIVAYHYDHTSGKTKRGINIVSFTYVNRKIEPKVKIPIAFELIRKDIEETKTVKDKKTGKFIQKTSRKASISKNELLRTRLKTLTHQNNIKYRHIVFDTWYSSAENMNFIVNDLKKHFVCAIKNNRTITFDVEKTSKEQQWLSVSEANIEPNCPYKIKLKKIPFSLVLVKKVFHNLNGTVGVQYLVTSDIELDAEKCSTIYKDRWSSEDIHRSLKQNTALEKMPAKMECSQANHVFASMIAQVKLETMKMATKTNHYTLKRNILMDALKQAWKQIQKLKELCLKKSFELPNLFTA
jgi:hypothetical protein